MEVFAIKSLIETYTPIPAPIAVVFKDEIEYMSDLLGIKPTFE